MNAKFVKKIIAINNILADWDPLGTQLIDVRYPFSEYENYILPIIETYESKESVFSYLVNLKLNLFGGLNKDLQDEIREVTIKIEKVLSSD